MAKYSSKAILICVGVAAVTAVLLASFYLLAAHPSSDPDVTPGEPGKKAPARCDHDRGIEDCLGRKSMDFATLNAENIAR